MEKQFKDIPRNIIIMETEMKYKNWIIQQLENYNNNTDEMRNPEIKKKFEEFLTEYADSGFIPTPKDIWKAKKQQLKEYTKEHGRLPSIYDKNMEIRKLAKWAHIQIREGKIKIKYIEEKDGKTI